MITVIGKPSILPVYFHHPHVDEVIEIHSKNIMEILRISRVLRNKRYDLAVVLPNSFRSGWTVFLALIPNRIGYAQNLRSLLLTHPVRRPRELLRMHQRNAYLKLLEPLGVMAPDEESGRIHLTTEEKEEAVRLTPGQYIWVGIATGASYGAAKRWFPERFAQVADSLAIHGAQIIPFGDTRDEIVCERVSQHMTQPHKNLAGKTSLRLAAALIERCRLLITNDSGAMHLAGSLGVKSIALFGSTDPMRTGLRDPKSTFIWHQVLCSPCFKRTCPYGHYECMKKITVDDVLKKARTILSCESTS